MLFNASSHPFSFVCVAPTRLFTSEPQPARVDTKEALTGYYVTIHHFFVGAILEQDLNFMTFVKWRRQPVSKVEAHHGGYALHFSVLSLSLWSSLCCSFPNEKNERRERLTFAKKKHARGSHGNKNYLLQSVSWTIKVPTRILYRSCASRRWTTRLLAKSPPSPRT